MRKILLGVLPAFLALAVFDASAGYVPYVPPAAATQSGGYDQNGDNFITADEVEEELREDAIDKVITMQKKGMSQKEIDRVIIDMERTVEQDAEKIIDILDADADELVEPSELD
ncbi:MAG: hypothetical protein RQ733_08865 [Methyloprofundus sp.]|nr:hypothetical protein [Methyloprofundus sp.]MDT8426070.1 hypothetical protein [Methyloprofundus sp.]